MCVGLFFFLLKATQQFIQYLGLQFLSLFRYPISCSEHSYASSNGVIDKVAGHVEESFGTPRSGLLQNIILTHSTLQL